MIDVHVSTTVSRALAQNGHDVVRAALAYRTWEDPDLLTLAVAEQRVIVTQDSDFTDLIYAFGASAPPAIIYLRFEPQDEIDVPQRVLDVLDSPLLSGHMVVIKPASTRFRPFPTVSNDNG